MPQFFPEFEELLHNLKAFNKETILFGDFNIDTLKDSTEKKKYESILTAFNFQIRNFEPPRVTPKTKTCLDHFISSNYFSTKTLKTTISDHYSVLLEIPDAKKEMHDDTFRSRNLKKLKGKNRLNFLFVLDQNLKKIPLNLDIDDLSTSIADSIIESVNKFAPEKCHHPINNSDTWITNSVKNAINKRDKLFQKWVSNPSDENHRLYKTQRNNVTAIIRKAKRDDNFKKLGSNPTAKSIYRTLKTHKNEVLGLQDYPELNSLNKHFATIGSRLPSKLPIENLTLNMPANENSMVIFPTDELEIGKIISNLKNKKSHGHDGISNEILKCCSPIVEPYLANAFNRAIEESKFPSAFKIAKIIPLFKKGDRSKLENYRPISLLSSLSKVFEKLLYQRMINFCEINQLFTSAQFGFRSKKSCADAIMLVTEYMRDEIDKKSSGQACFIDLQKAFDTLDHDILLMKLYEYGFRGEVNILLRSYLSDRVQYISISGKTTSCQKIETGVPQGSILGPLLFLLYINDIAKCDINCKIALFADDTSILKTNRKNDTGIQQDVNELINWYTANKLSVNLDKCEILPFGSGQPDEIKMMNNTIPYKKSCKYLGIHLDSSLRFNHHIEYVVKKLNKFCGLIYRIRHFYDIKCLLMFYNSFAKTVICYGLLIYGAAAKSNLRKIEMAQRRILRAIFFKRKYDSLVNVLQKNNILSVFELYLVELIKELFKQFQNKSPTSFLPQLETNVSRSITTRYQKNHSLPLARGRTLIKRKCLQNALCKSYNWLGQFNLLPCDMHLMTKSQIHTYIKKTRKTLYR